MSGLVVSRYTGKTEGSPLGSPHWEHPEGEWVKWEDYACLKAEVERLTKAHSDALADFWAIHKGYFDLKDEVERLRKAGDAMAEEIIGCYKGEGYDPKDSESLRDWNAAKEGKQS